MEAQPALPRRLLAALLALVGVLLPLLSRASAHPLTAAGGSSDPFAPGLRWTWEAGADEPWIPRDLVLVGDGELVWGGLAGGSPGVALLGTGGTEDPDAPLLVDPGFAGAIGPVLVAAGDEASELYALAQYPTTPAPARRSVVTRHDATGAAGGAGFAPVWSRELGQTGNGGAFLETTPDGDVVVAACFDVASSTVRMERIDPAGGSLLAHASVPAVALRNLAISADGERIVLLLGLEVVVLDGGLGVRHAEGLTGASGALAVSADGSIVAVGDVDEVRLLEEGPGGWSSRVASAAGVNEIVVGAALCDDGDVLALTWWNDATEADVRCEILDVASGAVLGTWSQSSPPGGLQNLPAALSITPGGERVALGLWGVGDTRPELILLEVGSPTPLLAADLPGSVYALDLDRSGTRLAVGMKDRHANLFSATGAVRLHDTGERDLQLVADPRLGGQLEAACLRAGSHTVVFAVGPPLAAPIYLPALGGELWLDVAAGLLLFQESSDAGGRARMSAPIPSDPALAGLPLGLQAVALLTTGGPRLAGALVRPILL